MYVVAVEKVTVAFWESPAGPPQDDCGSAALPLDKPASVGEFTSVQN